MDIWTLLVGAGVVIGIAAGIAQVLDYLQKQPGQNIHATPDLRQRGIAKWLRPGRKNDRQILSPPVARSQTGHSR